MPQMIDVDVPVWMFEKLEEIATSQNITTEEAALIFWAKGGTHPTSETKAA